MPGIRVITFFVVTSAPHFVFCTKTEDQDQGRIFCDFIYLLVFDRTSGVDSSTERWGLTIVVNDFTAPLWCSSALTVHQPLVDLYRAPDIAP
jgi:hypothetical protein